MSNPSEISKTSLVRPSPTDTPEISAVLFDYGQVLSKGPNATAWGRLCGTIGGSPEAFYDAYWKSRHDYDRGTISGTVYWQRVAEASGHAKIHEEKLEELYEIDVELWADLNEPMVAWARNLQRQGFRTGILSNIGDRMEIGIRRRFDWISDFHHCTWSHRLMLAKPELAIYEHAANALDTPPNNILFIDDREGERGRRSRCRYDSDDLPDTRSISRRDATHWTQSPSKRCRN